MTDPDLFSMKPAARRSDPETSYAAARDAGLKATAHRLWVLRLLSGRAMTDFELADATGLQQTSVGKRRGELAAHGYVSAALDKDENPIRRKTPSGSQATVWQITPKGCDYYRAHAK